MAAWRVLFQRHRSWSAATAGSFAATLGFAIDDARSAVVQVAVLGGQFIFGAAAVHLTFTRLHHGYKVARWRSWTASLSGGAVAAIGGMVADGVDTAAPKFTAYALLAVLGGTSVYFTLGAPLGRPLSEADEDSTAAQDTQPPALPLVRPSALPRPHRAFRGRREELDRLVALRGPETTLSDSAFAASDPTMIVLYGMPGIGKSALAQRFAHEIAPQYEGHLYASLRTAGAARAPGDVLGVLLGQLGWVEPLPATTAERASILRRITAGRRLLFLLDAASNADQVRGILPTEPRCTVILTSRRNLTAELGGRPYLVGSPSTRDARAILRSYAGLDPLDSASTMAQIADLCARLPLALRSAGEQIADGVPPRILAERLEPEANRLAVLNYGGRDVADRIASEYDRLDVRAQAALWLLADADLTSFVPSVLVPLIDVEPAEAAATVTQLSDTQLIRVLERGDRSGLVRYSLHPLVRLFLRTRGHPRGVPVVEEAWPEALSRLDLAYLRAAHRVLQAGDFGYEGNRFHTDVEPGFPDDGIWPERIAQYPYDWVRVEHANLVRAVHEAYFREEYELCFHLAIWLCVCLPLDLDRQRVVEALDLGGASAERVGTEIDRAELAVARGSFFAAIELYEQAFAPIVEAAALSAAAKMNGDGRAARMPARLALARGEAYLQMAAYREARTALEDVPSPGGSAEVHLRLARAELLAATDPTRWADSTEFTRASASQNGYGSAHDVSDGCDFRATLGLADVARKLEQWDESEHRLGLARVQRIGDARRTAAAEYRLARLAWYRARGESGQRGTALSNTVEYSVDAMVTFRRMHNPVGELRARCLLVRALVAAGRLEAAEEELVIAHGQVVSLGRSHDLGLRPLLPRLLRAHGQLLLARGNSVEEAAALLRNAEQLFGEAADWWSEADTRVLLAEAELLAGRPGPARVAAQAAAHAFHLGGDRIGEQQARAFLGRMPD